MRPFLTADWKNLILLNYEVPPELLEPRLPAHTSLDLWQGKCLVSVVGFYFANTSVLGLPIPGHRNFEEVNLRFYVTHTTDQGELRRGVVFVRELVPRWAIATVARVLYNEPYIATPMAHQTTVLKDGVQSHAYRWKYRRVDFEVAATVQGVPQPLVPGSEAEFITEHYYGYTRQRDGSTQEYRVEHPAWRVWTPISAHFHGDPSELYGSEFAPYLAVTPRSTMVAEGSPVAVYPGQRLRHGR